jgi:hypothetical protein
MRMYVRTAAALCRTESISTKSPLLPERLARYLARHPGARANLGRFVTYCATQIGWPIELPSRNSKSSRAATHRVIDSFQRQLREIIHAGIEQASIEDLARLVATAFALPTEVLNERAWELDKSSDAFVLRSDHYQLNVPKSLSGVVARWVALKSAAPAPQ